MTSVDQRLLSTISVSSMASSLSPECTPLKTAYDACFNSWFEGYLQPAVSALQSADRAAYAKAKADEYERKCGKIWQEYKACVHVRRIPIPSFKSLLY
jgi:hypothetical protein